MTKTTSTRIKAQDTFNLKNFIWVGMIIGGIILGIVTLISITKWPTLTSLIVGMLSIFLLVSGISCAACRGVSCPY